jgi:type I restriction enzyme M protein
MMKLLLVKVFTEKTGTEEEFFVTPDEVDTAQGHGRLGSFQERMRRLYSKATASLNGLLEENDGFKLRAATLAYAVERIQHVSLSGSSSDVKGLAFQKFVYAKQRIGRGQFFTPEQIVRLCVEFIGPRPGERVLDPACGTGGFLSQALHYMRARAPAPSTGAGSEKADVRVYGIEINPMVARTAKIRLLIDGAEFSPIVCCDALGDWPSINHAINRVCGDNLSYEEYFDVILTNPPFGSQGKIREPSVLERFDLGHKWHVTNGQPQKAGGLLGGQVPDILFVERCLDFLRAGGRMAIVLPNGDLENSSLDYLRAYILRRAAILAVVALPPETFVPFGTGVKASVLFLQKRQRDKGAQVDRARGKMFFGHIQKIGYQGNKNASPVYKKDASGVTVTEADGRPVVDEDISSLIEAYRRFSEGRAPEGLKFCFAVPGENVVSRLDVDYYKPAALDLETLLRDRGAKRLGDIAAIVKRRSPKFNEPELEVLYVELADVNAQQSEITGGTMMQVHELPSRATYELREGDVITAVAGNSIGTVNHVSTIVTHEYAGAICTNGFRILRPGSEIDPYYLLYFLRTPYFLRQVMRYRTGAAIPSISDEDLERVLVFLPPKDEQERIAKHLIKCFELRQASKRVLEEIKLDIGVE